MGLSGWTLVLDHSIEETLISLILSTCQSLTFKTAVKKNIQDTVLVNNSGNITLHLSLGVTAFPACFSISPARLAIRPGGQEHVAVTFSPLESDVYRYQRWEVVLVVPATWLCIPRMDLFRQFCMLEVRGERFDILVEMVCYYVDHGK